MTRLKKLALLTATVMAGPLTAAAPAHATLPAHPSGSHIRVNHGAMPLSAAPDAPPAPAPHLNYSGGPVVSNAQVTTVQWGAGSAYGDFGSFFGGVLRSPYVSWLREYDTPAPPNGTSQHIGYGTFAGAAGLAPDIPGPTVDDTDIQRNLLSAVAAHTLRAPAADSGGNVNTIYAVFFPHGYTITLGKDASGVTFCAYHGATTNTYAGHHLLYMVLPDPTTGGMATGCGSHSAVDNLESYTSHELIETITDPLVALAGPTDAPPLAWYDDANGEIADICANQTNPDGTVTGSDGVDYTVQQGWSNGLNACIVARTATPPAAPTGFAAAARSGGRVRLTWSEPLNDGYSPVTNYDVYRSTSATVRGPLITSAPTSTSYVDTPPSDGRYYYTVRADNAAGAGALSAQRAAFADSTVPTIKMTAPASLFSLTTGAATKYLGSDSGSGVTSYDVHYRLARWNGGFGSWVSPGTWQHTTATHESLTTSLGHEYCFTAVARDAAGNLSHTSTQHCQVRPLDERSFTRSAHWSTSSSSWAYRHTLTSTTTKGATLTLKGVRAHRLALVLQSCAKCGRVKVYVGKTLIATIDMHSATTKNKVIKILAAFSLRTADVRLVAADTGKRVVVDGIGVSLT